MSSGQWRNNHVTRWINVQGPKFFNEKISCTFIVQATSAAYSSRTYLQKESKDLVFVSLLTKLEKNISCLGPIQSVHCDWCDCKETPKNFRFTNVWGMEGRRRKWSKVMEGQAQRGKERAPNQMCPTSPKCCVMPVILKSCVRTTFFRCSTPSLSPHASQVYPHSHPMP